MTDTSLIAEVTDLTLAPSNSISTRITLAYNEENIPGLRYSQKSVINWYTSRACGMLERFVHPGID
jgi:hypothetical protein